MVNPGLLATPPSCRTATGVTEGKTVIFAPVRPSRAFENGPERPRGAMAHLPDAGAGQNAGAPPFHKRQSQARRPRHGTLTKPHRQIKPPGVYQIRPGEFKRIIGPWPFRGHPFRGHAAGSALATAEETTSARGCMTVCAAFQGGYWPARRMNSLASRLPSGQVQVTSSTYVWSRPAWVSSSNS